MQVCKALLPPLHVLWGDAQQQQQQQQPPCLTQSTVMLAKDALLAYRSSGRSCRSYSRPCTSRLGALSRRLDSHQDLIRSRCSEHESAPNSADWPLRLD